MNKLASMVLELPPFAEMAASPQQYAAITDAIIRALDRGIAPWRQPWHGGVAGRLPYNAVSGRRYRGLNVALLALTAIEQGYGDPRWLTFNQAGDKGGNIKRGSKGVRIFFWKVESVRAVDDQGQPILDADGNNKLTTRFMVRMYTVFNVQQTEGIAWPLLEPPPKSTFQPVESAERIAARYIERTGLKVVYDREPRAYYRPSTDLLHMPTVELFDNTAGYYSTLFHELGHSSGHPARLKRRDVPDEPIVFGSPNYSKEELVAEFASAFLSAEVGLDTIEPSAAYIKNWLSALQNDRAMAVFAAAAGQKASDYILGSTEEDQPEDAESVPQPEVVTAAQAAELLDIMPW